jgi:hypothetical protein
MVIRFRLRPTEVRLETHPSGLNRTGPRRLTRREIEHRERMLRHLARTRVRQGFGEAGERGTSNL